MGKRLLLAAAALIVLPLVGGFAVFFVFPGVLITAGQWSAARGAGLQTRVVTADGTPVHVFVGGPAHGPALVLLHGMADDRHSFVNAAADLTDRYRVVLPDLRGHSDNRRDPDADHSIRGQVRLVAGLADTLGLDRFDLGGNSMGGHVSAAFALAYPDRVRRLVLVNAPGLKLGDHEVYAGFEGELKTRADFDALMQRVLHRPPALPGPVADHLRERANANAAFVNRMAAQVRDGVDYDLKDRLAELSAPTLVLWGEHDRVVPFDVAEAWRDGLPDGEFQLLSDAGHSPQLEQPAEVAAAIRAFLDR